MAKPRENQKHDAGREYYRSQLLMAISHHVGRSRAIGMGELYQKVTGEEWKNRINDTRYLRGLVTDLRRDGVPICSHSSQHGGGYYLASVGSELTDYCRGLRNKALGLLAREAMLKKTSLPELLGQMSVELKEG